MLKYENNKVQVCLTRKIETASMLKYENRDCKYSQL